MIPPMHKVDEECSNKLDEVLFLQELIQREPDTEIDSCSDGDRSKMLQE